MGIRNNWVTFFFAPKKVEKLKDRLVMYPIIKTILHLLFRAIFHLERGAQHKNHITRLHYKWACTMATPKWQISKTWTRLMDKKKETRMENIQFWLRSRYDWITQSCALFKENHVLIYFRRRVSGIIVNFLCVLNVVCRRNIVCITG